MSVSRSHDNKKNRLRYWLVIGLLVVVVAVGGYALFGNRTMANMNDVNVVIEKVDKLYVLPEGEKPALATVTDSRKLASSFAGKVKNGDKILIYQEHQIAVAYRPQLNKIVAVVAVDIDSIPQVPVK